MRWKQTDRDIVFLKGKIQTSIKYRHADLIHYRPCFNCFSRMSKDPLNQKWFCSQTVHSKTILASVTYFKNPQELVQAEVQSQVSKTINRRISNRIRPDNIILLTASDTMTRMPSSLMSKQSLVSQMETSKPKIVSWKSIRMQTCLQTSIVRALLRVNWTSMASCSPILWRFALCISQFWDASGPFWEQSLTKGERCLFINTGMSRPTYKTLNSSWTI